MFADVPEGSRTFSRSSIWQNVPEHNRPRIVQEWTAEEKPVHDSDTQDTLGTNHTPEAGYDHPDKDNHTQSEMTLPKNKDEQTGFVSVQDLRPSKCVFFQGTK